MSNKSTLFLKGEHQKKAYRLAKLLEKHYGKEADKDVRLDIEYLKVISKTDYHDHIFDYHAYPSCYRKYKDLLNLSDPYEDSQAID